MSMPAFAAFVQKACRSTWGVICGSGLSGCSFWYFFIARRISFSMCRATFGLSFLSSRRKPLYPSIIVSVFTRNFQAPANLVRHGYVAAAALGFWFLHIILAVALPAKPVIYPELPPGKGQINLRQPAVLANAHSDSQQYHKLAVILAVDLVLLDEIHPRHLLFLRHSNALP